MTTLLIFQVAFGITLVALIVFVVLWVTKTGPTPKLTLITSGVEFTYSPSIGYSKITLTPASDSTLSGSLTSLTGVTTNYTTGGSWQPTCSGIVTFTFPTNMYSDMNAAGYGMSTYTSLITDPNSFSVAYGTFTPPNAVMVTFTANSKVNANKKS